jgi:N-acetylmuramoyl-L-alanine amidase
MRRTYAINDNHIYGYGIPRWSYATGTSSSPSSTSEAAAPSSGSTVLKYGSTGAQVKKLQENLIKLGYSCGKYGADGDFGNDTLTAVKAFQKANNLTQDGVVGPLTQAAIEKQLKKTTSSKPAQSSTKTYTVKHGDSLWKIASE